MQHCEAHDEFIEKMAEMGSDIKHLVGAVDSIQTKLNNGLSKSVTQLQEFQKDQVRKQRNYDRWLQIMGGATFTAILGLILTLIFGS